MSGHQPNEEIHKVGNWGSCQQPALICQPPNKPSWKQILQLQWSLRVTAACWHLDCKRVLYFLWHLTWQTTFSPVTPLFFSFHITVFQGYYPTSLTMFSSGFMLLLIFLSLLKCWFSHGSVFLLQPLLSPSNHLIHFCVTNHNVSANDSN